MKLDQPKKDASTCDVYSATNDTDKRKAIAMQSVLNKYGTSCFLQLCNTFMPQIKRIHMVCGHISHVLHVYKA